jgi:hypothetical protein
MICGLGLAVRASAGEPAVPESSTAKTNKPAYNTSLRAGETVGIHQIQRAFLTVGTNEIAFIIPGEYRLDASNPERILLTDNVNGGFITVRIGSRPEGETGAEAGFYKAQALSRFPGAKIIEESMDMVANHSGPAFNLFWLNSEGVAQSARIDFIPTAAGVLELSVMSQSAHFKDARNSFEILQGSIQNNESGKLVITPLPDFS